jgi:hypothetical protein
MGYGAVVMTNGGTAQPLLQELIDRVARAHGWDTLDKAPLR